MKRINQEGFVSTLLILFIFAVVLLVGAVGFGVWAWSGRQDYKNNVNQKVNAAVTVAKQQEASLKDTEYAAAEKLPLRTYTGPEAFGSLIVSYPKTWSAYVDEADTGSTVVNGYFYPNVVPSVTNPNNSFALRVQIINQSYSDVMQQFSGLVSTQKITVAPYALPKVASAVGSRLDGQVVPNKSGSMVVIPLRDKTLEVWTEAQQFESDFNNNVLPNLSFSP